MAVVYQDMAISKSLVFKNSFPFALQSAADMVSRSPLMVFRFLNGLLMVKTCSFFFFKVGKVLECVAWFTRGRGEQGHRPGWKRGFRVGVGFILQKQKYFNKSKKSTNRPINFNQGISAVLIVTATFPQQLETQKVIAVHLSLRAHTWKCPARMIPLAPSR